MGSMRPKGSSRNQPIRGVTTRSRARARINLDPYGEDRSTRIPGLTKYEVVAPPRVVPIDPHNIFPGRVKHALLRCVETAPNCRIWEFRLDRGQGNNPPDWEPIRRPEQRSQPLNLDPPAESNDEPNQICWLIRPRTPVGETTFFVQSVD